MEKCGLGQKKIPNVIISYVQILLTLCYNQEKMDHNVANLIAPFPIHVQSRQCHLKMTDYKAKKGLQILIRGGKNHTLRVHFRCPSTFKLY